MDNLIKDLYGKIVNQPVKRQMGGILCEKCQTIVSKPRISTLDVSSIGENPVPALWEGNTYSIYYYLKEQPELIFESKSGHAVCYCNKYCAAKHNHKFNRRK